MTVNQTFLMHRSTYAKQYSLLETLSGSGIFIGRQYARTFDNGILYISASTTGATPDQQRLYTNTDAGTYITRSTSNEYITGLYGETTTPPGWGVYTNASLSAINRWNADDATEYVTSTSQLSRFTWCNQEQSLFCLRYNGSYTRVVKVSAFNWAAHTCTTDTAFGPAYSTDILDNGGLVDGRIYVCSDNSINTGRLGWVNALNGTYTELVDYAQDTGTGIVYASNYLGSGAGIAIQCGDTGTGNRVDLWSSAGSRAGQVTLASESATSYGGLTDWVHDRVNNYLWVRRSTNIFVIDPVNGTVRDTWTSADLPGSGAGLQLIGPLGAPTGGVYALMGSPLNKLYKLG